MVKLASKIMNVAICLIINLQILEEALTSMPVPQYRQVYIPKFSLRMRSDLKEPLEALGINAMFDISRANLTGDAVSKVLHESMIEVIR